MAKIHIGISGWRHAPWRGKFYPAALAQARELDYAARQRPSIEVNGSFYSLQRPDSYAAWYAATPPGFLFTVKGNRFITHMLKLKDIDAPLANMLASGMFALPGAVRQRLRRRSDRTLGREDPRLERTRRCVLLLR